MMNANAAMQQYRRVGATTSIEDASPHKLILMLLTGAQDRLSAALGFMQRGNISDKGQSIGTAIKIIDGLRASLDFKAGGEISENLDSLYDYMGRRLLEANLRNDPKVLNEVSSLLQEITVAWVGITPEANKH